MFLAVMTPLIRLKLDKKSFKSCMWPHNIGQTRSVFFFFYYEIVLQCTLHVLSWLGLSAVFSEKETWYVERGRFFSARVNNYPSWLVIVLFGVKIWFFLKASLDKNSQILCGIERGITPSDGHLFTEWMCVCVCSTNWTKLMEGGRGGG